MLTLVDQLTNRLIDRHLLRRNCFVLPVQRRAQRVPRQARALHAHRELAHAAEHGELSQSFRIIGIEAPRDEAL